MKSFEQFNHTELPSYEDFKSSLKIKNIARIDYLKAQVMWKLLGCKTFKDYHDFYLKLDVVLLAEVWNMYLQVNREAHNLDQNHFISAPSLNFQAMLKTIPKEMGDIHAFHREYEVTDNETNIKKTYPGQDSMYYRYEELKGGLSSALSKRYALANNPHVEQYSNGKYTYDKSKPTTYIAYLDARSLYWHSMLQCLPMRNFTEITKIKIESLKTLLMIYYSSS